MKVGTVLATRDGRRIGNAVIIGIRKFPINDKETGRIYRLKTDFGNVLDLYAYEIYENFYFPTHFLYQKQTVKRWMKARFDLFWKGIE